MIDFRSLAFGPVGSPIRQIATMCVCISFGAVVSAWVLDRVTHNGALPGLVDTASLQALPHGSPVPREASLRQTTVDYLPTGSIPANLAAPIVLDPCTGRIK